MTTINKTSILPYSCEEIYKVVTNIEEYPDFLPWCDSVSVHINTETEAEATLNIRKGKLTIAFTTHNDMIPNQQIKLRLLKGPFKRLSGLWVFTSIKENVTRVSLKLEFEFSSRIIAMALGMLFNQITSTMLDAFCERTKKIYGERNL
jgi:ribosome-associated toxin RatA of RatAB toxin-antitoxin module